MESEVLPVQTEVRLAIFAELALTTGDQGIGDNAVAYEALIDVFTDFSDCSGNVAAGDMRKGDNDARVAASNDEIDLIEAGGRDFDEDFTFARLWGGKVSGVCKDVTVAVSGN